MALFRRDRKRDHPPAAGAPTPAPIAHVVPLRATPDHRTPDPVHMARPPEQQPGQPTWPEPAQPPGTAVAPTGEFGPPPVMNPPPPPFLASLQDPDPAAGPTPPRGFDAMAEAVLGNDGPPGPLAEPTAGIHEAVRAGRTTAAAELATRTLAQASATWGPLHPDVLRLRELSAYIAYLAGDPAHAFHLSLDLARIHHRAHAPEAAYGNLQSAATAWRAVRDPHQGLELGHSLIALWTELAAAQGPAAADLEQLHKAHTRMTRLTARAHDNNA